MRNVEINVLSSENQWCLIGMPMAQVETIKKEEKCLTTPHRIHVNAYTEASESGSRQKKERELK